MKFLKKIYKNVEEFFYDHSTFRTICDYLFTFFIACLSSFIYAYNFRAFVAPLFEGQNAIITGGASGVSQICAKISELLGVPVNESFGNSSVGYIIQTSFYVIVNIPLIILAYKKIGKKFALFTIINVSMYFVFANIIPDSICDIFYSNSYGVELQMFGRAVFSGVLTGVTAALSISHGHSAGGIDIISVYFTDRDTNASIGKISLTVNTGIIVVYAILTFIQAGDLSFLTMALYSFVYFFVSSVVTDKLIIRNKKESLQIITSNESMPDILINYFPHSATIVQGKGAYSKQDKLVIYIVLSTKEVKKCMTLVKEFDQNAFIVSTKVNSLSGRFYIAPHK